MKSINYFLLLVFALALTIPSCKKDAKTATEILTSKSWKMTSFKINSVELIEDCDKDDFITFLAGGTYTYNVGTTTCYDGDVNYDGTWSLSADEKTLTVDGVGATVVITESQCTITYADGSDSITMIYIPK